ncbi:unnamed protein product [Schistosoma margrebowiei]|uniref:UV excision repair protein RAD23 n=1 Tax=Schistosoma margrebowiei TaxID=48269 RepID=A0A183MQD8_9TREM|nr:unnamed protein product [Schistosoma margrebowiei]
MKVTFKTLMQQTFVLDFQEDDLVIHSEFDAKTQKLIHSGKLPIIAYYKVTESGFVVVMSVSNASVQINPTANEAPSSKPDSNPQSNLPTVTTAPSSATKSSLVTGENFERVVKELVSMGFERSLVIQAMRAGFNNPDRAFEYLSSGNIPNVDIVDQPPQREEIESSESLGSEDPIAALASLPQFQQMRALVQANPELLPQLIQQIGNDNADLFRLIQENEQAFLEFINTPVTGTTRPGGQRQTVLTMTAEERAAVDRLKALGFPEELVIQVSFQEMYPVSVVSIPSIKLYISLILYKSSGKSFST